MIKKYYILFLAILSSCVCKHCADESPLEKRYHLKHEEMLPCENFSPYHDGVLDYVKGYVLVPIVYY